VGGFKLGSGAFSRLGAKIYDLHLPTVVVQEGGYLLPSLGENVVSFLKGVLGQ
jgi:acetoin utilization deacetylase AcuC-like enzyme